MKTLIQDYFGFNREQRNGLLVLSFISFSLLIVRVIFPLLIKPDNIVIQNLPLIERTLSSDDEANSFSENRTVKLFAFNPNTVSLEQLLRLGFKEKTAKTFLKYRS